jgi:ankyrin repeat protein
MGDVNLPDDAGQTALHLAARRGKRNEMSEAAQPVKRFFTGAE